MIKKILIANRGEIALRVIKACHEMQIPTVAIYSDADRTAPHVQSATEAVHIGPAAPLESYLNIQKIVETAKITNCDAIHPGYGFLAENAAFARQCEAAGIVFIGPNSQALQLAGDKLQSRKILARAGIPMIPGMITRAPDISQLIQQAEKIGFSVMVKASAGGGGKGMRIVRQAADLQAAVEAGQREAKSAFGDETVYLEKYIEKPRHIEFQVLADNFGNCVHLFERECSIQRRHQKIVEESPSVVLNPEMREEMGDAARKVVEITGYTNAGTVEFLVDQNKNFYFLEMNARIQVEHPVTEMVTQVDLVKQQIRIARGEKLAFRQKDLRQSGHAIECRIYAEDPDNNFFPSFGKLQLVKEPTGPNIRCDSGIYTGQEVTHHYDPILSKLIVWDETRPQAIQKMITALADYVILGVKTQIPFLRDLMQHPDFQAGNLHTNFIAENLADWKETQSNEKLLFALVTAALAKKQNVLTGGETTGRPALTPWQTLGEWEQFAQ